MSAIRTIEVRNHVWPGGIGVRPPSVEAPYWRTAEGQRHSFKTVLIGVNPERRTELVDRHADAVADLVRASEEARQEKRFVDARTLAGSAARLCEELNGLWPDGSWESN